MDKAPIKRFVSCIVLCINKSAYAKYGVNGPLAVSAQSMASNQKAVSFALIGAVFTCSGACTARNRGTPPSFISQTFHCMSLP